MIDSENVYLAPVDRLSGSGNAMVSLPDAEVNLGPLPAAVDNEWVVFVYLGGVWGVCLDEQWISDSYLSDMVSRVDYSFKELESLVRDGELDARNTDVPDPDEHLRVETVRSTETGTLARYESIPVVLPDAEYPIGEQLDIRVTGRKNSYLVGEFVPQELDSFSVADYDELGDATETQRIIKDGTPLDVRPLPPGISRPAEIEIFDVGDNALTGVWNVKASVGGYGELSIGDILELEVTAVDGELFVGENSEFPVQGRCSHPLPDELVGESIRVEIRNLAPDRAAAVPVLPSVEVGEQVTVQLVGVTSTAAVGVYDGGIVRIPSSDILEPGHTIAVGITGIQDTELLGEISALPDLRTASDLPRTVCLPETTGDLVWIDDVPVRTTDLPDISAPVLLGVGSVATDHIVPSITALPEAHQPNHGDYLIVSNVFSAEDDTVRGVSDGFPIELQVPFVESTEHLVRVITVAPGKVEGIAIGLPAADAPSLTACYKQLLSAIQLFDTGKYRAAKEAFAEALERLPSDEPVRKSILQAHHALVHATEVLGSDSVESALNDIRETKNQMAEVSAPEGDVAKDFGALLNAYEHQLAAVLHLLEALRDGRREQDTQLQAIARGSTAKRPVQATAHELRSAENTVDGTRFETHIPSPETSPLLERFEKEFPLPVDELAAWRGDRDVAERSHRWMQAVFPPDVSEKADDSLEFDREATADLDEIVWERPSAGNVVLGASEKKDGMGDPLMGALADTDESPASPGNLSVREGESLSTPESNATSEKEDTDSEPPNTSTTPRSQESAAGADSSSPAAETDEAPADTAQDTDSSEAQETAASSSTAVDTNPVGVEVPEETMELKKLRKAADADATEDPVRQDVDSSGGSQYRRSQAIREYVLARADGSCEACEEPAPFTKPDGDPYLEVHHVDELSAGGADDPSHVVAICPACHREIHYGVAGDALNERLRKKLDEGLGDVGTT